MQRSRRSKLFSLKNIFFLFVQFFTICLAENEKKCCPNILLNGDNNVHEKHGDKLGFYKQFGQHDGRPAYRQEGGSYILLYNGTEKKWVDSNLDKFIGRDSLQKFRDADFQQGIGRLQNNFDAHCLGYDEKSHNWTYQSFQKGQPLMTYSESLITKCIEEKCCTKINITKEYSDSLFGNRTFFDNLEKEIFGVYEAVGMAQGRYIYQRNSIDTLLVYNPPVFKSSHYHYTWVILWNGGIIHNEFLGEKVCPEQIKNEWGIMPNFKHGDEITVKLDITCIEPKAGHTGETIRTSTTKATTTTTTKRIAPKNATTTTTPKKIKTTITTTSTTTAKQTSTKSTTTTTTSNYSTSATVFGCFTLVLLLVMTIVFGRRFRRSWSRGAKGKQLLWETLDLQ